jgi:hypothetical protein
MLELFKRFAENVYVNLVSGMVLLATSGMEILESLLHGVNYRIKMAYFEDGAVPSHRWYGWVTK